MRHYNPNITCYNKYNSSAPGDYHMGAGADDVDYNSSVYEYYIPTRGYEIKYACESNMSDYDVSMTSSKPLKDQSHLPTRIQVVW